MFYKVAKNLYDGNEKNNWLINNCISKQNYNFKTEQKSHEICQTVIYVCSRSTRVKWISRYASILTRVTDVRSYFYASRHNGQRVVKTEPEI